MEYIVLGEELSIEFAEVVCNLDDIDELAVLGEITNKMVLGSLRDYTIYYIYEDFYDGVPVFEIDNIHEYTVVSCNSYKYIFNKVSEAINNSVSINQLNPDTKKLTTLGKYLLRCTKKCDHEVMKVITSRSVYECIGINRDDVKHIVNSKIGEIDFESSVNDVVYFNFTNPNLVPSNRGIVSSGNPGYTHMCGLGTESFKCIDRRFLRGENSNADKCLVNCSLDREFTLSLTNYSNLYIDEELLRPSIGIVELNILIDGLKAYIVSDCVGYIYLNKLTDELVSRLCSIGIPVEKIKEWR